MRAIRFHPGETKVLQFLIPFQLMDVVAVVITCRNQRHTAFEAAATSFKEETITEIKDGSEVTQTKLRIGYTMSQAESLRFEENAIYKLQLNVFGPNGSRATSKEYDVVTLAQHVPESSIEELPLSEISHNVVDYTKLDNLPSINMETLIQNRNLPEHVITDSDIDNLL